MHNALSLSPEHINVCVCSFSEDSDSLSQWRAYGGSSGFAIGFSGEVLGAAVESQRFFLAQCIYDPGTQLNIVRALVEEVLDEARIFQRAGLREIGTLMRYSGIQAEISYPTSIDMPQC
jgi:hypothetical protein